MDPFSQNFYELLDAHLNLKIFSPRASQLYTRMLAQGGNKKQILRQIKKGFNRYPELFNKYLTNYNNLIQIISTEVS